MRIVISSLGKGTGRHRPIEAPDDLDLMAEDDPLAQELANVDALLEQSQRLLDKISEDKARRSSGTRCRRSRRSRFRLGRSGSPGAVEARSTR
jgi:hypothetical protein